MRPLWARFLPDSSPPHKVQYLVFPAFGYAPETKAEFGISSSAYFKNKSQLPTSRQSGLYAYLFYTQKNQFGFKTDHSIYTAYNKWAILGKYKLMYFPMLYYGLGPNTEKAPRFTVEGNYLLCRETFLRKLGYNIYAGVVLDFQKLSRVKILDAGVADTSGQIKSLGFGGSTNMGAGLSLVFDSRINYLNARTGYYAEATTIRYDNAWGSDFSFTNYLLDFRGYFTPFTAKQTWAVQAFMSSINQGHAPFNQLALLGSDQLMRGYYSGRFRDNRYAAVQTEYRFLPLPFSKRFGATVFGGVGSVAPKLVQFRPDQFKWTGGIGLRYLMIKSKDIFLRVDCAFTAEKPGVYFFLGEAF